MVVHLKICLDQPKFVMSWQTIRTCKMLVMTEYLSKQTPFSLVQKAPYVENFFILQDLANSQIIKWEI